MFADISISSFLLVALVGLAQASYLNNDLSFGHNAKISPNSHGVPHFHVMGKPDPPEILSNKIVLTPPAPGNQRGAIWAEKQLFYDHWTIDVDFRATGPERGGGNFNIWYAHDGQVEVGTSSIYTVGKFDGFVLVIDQYGGWGGFIRGFLNDGSTDYKSHHSVDSLAFGHCNYPYRNLGRATRIAIKQSHDTFRVNVDGHLCFESHKVKLPVGYYFGVTAASAEIPDGMELFKFTTTTESRDPDVHFGSHDSHETETQDQFHHDVHNDIRHENEQHYEYHHDDHHDDHHDNHHDSHPDSSHHDSDHNTNNGGHNSNPSYADLPDADPRTFRTNDAQFADLHNRLQALTKHFFSLHRDVADTQSSLSVLTAQLSKLEHSLSRLDQIPSMHDKLEIIQRDVRQTKGDLHDSLDRHVAGLRQAVGEGHDSMIGSVKGSKTGIGMFVVVVVASQVGLVALYAVYKKRKANGPKKYL